MSDAAPKVFLLPGIGGDEPPLADFRAAMGNRVAFELLDYPDVDRPSAEIRDFDGIVRHLLKRVSELEPLGIVHLAGYSFGGQAAFALACKLQEEGRSVGLLAILDSRAPTLRLPESAQRVTNTDDALSPAMACADFTSRLLISAGLSEAVRASIQPAGNLFGVKAGQSLRRLLLQNLRGRSLGGLEFGRFDGPILLFRAKEQLVRGLAADLGWSAHCTSVQAIELEGGHNSLFESNHLAANIDLVWSAIEGRVRSDQRR